MPDADVLAVTMPNGFEWVIILLVVVLLFGAKRLPDTARGLGRSLRILKSETRGLTAQDETSTDDADVRAERATDEPTGATRTAPDRADDRAMAADEHSGHPQER